MKSYPLEFEPENCPKWETLSEILCVEIPSDVKAAIEAKRRSANKPIVVLILCQDSRTCYQLNQYLTQGPEKYLLFTAMKNDVPIKKLSSAYKSVKESDINSIRLHGSQLQNETIKVDLPGRLFSAHFCTTLNLNECHISNLFISAPEFSQKFRLLNEKLPKIRRLNPMRVIKIKHWIRP